MPKEIRGKLFTPNVHMDAIYIRSLFSGSDRALIGSQPSRRCDALQVDSRESLSESFVAVQMIACPSVPMPLPLPLCRRLPCVTVPLPLCRRLPSVTVRFRRMASDDAFASDGINIYLVACIAFSQLLLRFTCVLCSSALRLRTPQRRRL